MACTPQVLMGYHQSASVDGSALSKSSKSFLRGLKESSSILQKSKGSRADTRDDGECCQLVI